MSVDGQLRHKAASFVFGQHGYNIEDYHVDLYVFDETNQIILVCDHARGQFLEIPIEMNALKMDAYELAKLIVEAIDQANSIS